MMVSQEGVFLVLVAADVVVDVVVAPVRCLWRSFGRCWWVVFRGREKFGVVAVVVMVVVVVVDDVLEVFILAASRPGRAMERNDERRGSQLSP